MPKNEKINNIEESKLTEDSLNTRGAAKYLNLTPKQLENYRGHKRGPKYTKIGRMCFYNTQDLDEWVKKPRGKVKSLAPTDRPKKIKKITMSSTDATIQAGIAQIKALLESKNGLFVNKTDIAIFKNITLTLTSLNQEIEALKKNFK